MELDVAAAGAGTAEVAAGVVTGGQGDIEDVIAARLAIVSDNHAGGSGRAVDEDVVIDLPGDPALAGCLA